MLRIVPRLALLLATAGSLLGIDLRYWIEPCTRPETACQKADVQLAEWALEAWHEAFEKMHAGEIVKAVLKPA